MTNLGDYQRKLRARAKKSLFDDAASATTAAEILRRAKRFLTVEMKFVKMAHRSPSVSGAQTCRMRSAVTDVIVEFIWERTTGALHVEGAGKRPISVVAVGGYGREMMSPHSDVDIRLLYPGGAGAFDTALKELIADFQQFLFDLKMQLAHGVNTVSEVLALANGDNETKTTLINARFVCGHKQAFEELKKRYDRECMKGREDEFLRLRQADIAERHGKHENTPFVQEPHVKEGCGGLRDYQSIGWMAYAKLRVASLKDLIEHGMITRAGWREMEEAHEFLLRVRNEMHYVEKREQDRLTLRLQGIIATNLGYRHKNMLKRIEVFMREYYTHTRNILQRSNEVMDRFHLQSVEEAAVPRRILGIPLPGKRARPEKFDGFISKNARIYAEHDRIFKEEPARLMRLFRHTQQRHLRLSPELFQLVQDSFRLIDQSFRYLKENRETFESILSQKGDVARVLRQMHRVGFLGKYMPEFGALTLLVQHEFFHRYTADEHTLRTIDRLDELSGATKDKRLEFYSHLFHEMQEPWILYLALLLHDTGRAANTRAHDEESTVLADAVARRLQIKGERRRLLIFLVNNHLLFYRTATSKSLEDPKVIEDFCNIVRSKQHLDALLVMTVADSRGTSEQSFSGFKEASIRQLYHAALLCLDAPADYMRLASAPVEQLKADVLRELGAGYEREIEAHFENMPRSYFSFRDAASIAAHIAQFREFFTRLIRDDPAAALLPVMRWIDHPEQGHSELVVTSWDRHLLLARIAGALAAESINILSAKLFQRADNLVLDVFRVCNTNLTAVTSKSARQRVEKAVNEAFASESFDFSARIAAKKKPGGNVLDISADIPQRVHITNSISPDNTVIELQAVDRLGLLYDVFTGIGALGHNITHARINTEQGAAIDTLYVQDQSGKMITDRDALAALRERLEIIIFGSALPPSQGSGPLGRSRV